MIYMVDPPWPQKKGGLRKVCPNQTRKLDYQTLSIEQIFSLLDKLFINIPHCIFLWEIDKFLLEAELNMEKRGYRRHARFVWNKLNGVAPAFTIRYTHEYMVWWYKPKLLPIEKSMRGKLPTVFEEKSREHSRKPTAAYKIIEQLYPTENKMDVFSREKRDGWEQWGDQLDYFKD